MDFPHSADPAEEARRALRFFSGPQRCIRPHCATDEYLVPDVIEASHLPGRANIMGWDVSYWCSRCDGYSGHLADSLPPQWTLPDNEDGILPGGKSIEPEGH